MVEKIKENLPNLKYYRTKFIIIAVSVFLCIIISAVSESAVVATNVVCGEDNETVVSFSRDPNVIVSKTSFDLNEGDRLELDGFDSSKGNSFIVIERNFENMDSFLSIASLAKSSPVKNAFNSVIERVELEKKNKPFKVKVTADGKTKKITMRGGTVEAALIMAGITLGEGDVVNLPLSVELKSGMEIAVKRVAYQGVTKTEEISFDTKKVYDETMYEGESYVKRAGENGEKTEYYMEILVDSKVKEQLKLGSTVTKKPVTEVVVYGSKKRIVQKNSTNSSGTDTYNAISELPAKINIELDENGRPTKYKQKLVGSATAYYGGYATATGEKPMPGRVAVDPRKIPYHSKLYIISCDGRYIYGYSEASDTGGFVHNSNTLVDLYFHTYSECVQFGRRNVEIYVLE